MRALGHSLGKLTDRVNLQRILRQRSDVAVLVIDQGRFPVPQYDDSQRSGLARIHETDEYQRIGRIVQPHQFVIVIRRIRLRIKLVPCVGTRHPQRPDSVDLDVDDPKVARLGIGPTPVIIQPERTGLPEARKRKRLGIHLLIRSVLVLAKERIDKLRVRQNIPVNIYRVDGLLSHYALPHKQRQ